MLSREQALSVFSDSAPPSLQARPIANDSGGGWSLARGTCARVGRRGFSPGRSLIAPRQTEALPAEEIAPPPSLTDTVIVTHPDYDNWPTG
jgi:hypothetical protein